MAWYDTRTGLSVFQEGKTMSETTLKQFHTPFGSNAIKRLIGLLHRAYSEQAVAAAQTATLMNKGIATHQGKIISLFVVLGVLPAAGESMTVDIRKNGVSILQGGTPITLNAALFTGTTKKYRGFLSFVDPTKLDIFYGDKLEVVRTYTPGGTPAMTTNVVGVEWAAVSDA